MMQITFEQYTELMKEINVMRETHQKLNDSLRLVERHFYAEIKKIDVLVYENNSLKEKILKQQKDEIRHLKHLLHLEAEQ